MLPMLEPWILAAVLGPMVAAGVVIALMLHQARRRSAGERRFRDFADASGEWFWETGPDRTITWVSERFEIVTGIPLKDAIGRRAGDLGYLHQSTEMHQLVENAIAAHRPFRGALYHIDTPRGRIWIEMNAVPVFDRRGAFQGYRGVSNNVSARVRAAESARAADLQLRATMDALPDIVVLCDAQDRIAMINRSVAREVPMTDAIEIGITFEEAIRRGVRTRFYKVEPGEEEAWVRERLSRHRSPGEPFEYETRRGRWFLVREVRMPDGGTATVSTDITQRKHAELEREAARRVAENANRTKSAFLANMSHELRTPLNAILGYAELIRRALHGPVPDRYRGYAGDILQSGTHLLDVINEVLDLSRIEAGHATLDDAAVDLRALADRAAALVGAQYGGGRIVSIVPDSLPMLRADETRVIQVLINLLTNAVKFAPTGDITVEAAREGRGLAVRVVDQGIGMSPEDLAVALQPYGRIDGDPFVRRTEGVGLGLPIVQHIMRLHGGTFEIQSTPGKGTRATVTFPEGRIVQAPPAPPVTPAPASVAQAPEAGATSSMKS
jgi:two-component system cell cycle sensor histidine kinase PleC